jgi:hypothetical protein
MPLGRACEFKQGNTTEIAASAMTTEVQPIADQPEDVTIDACFAQDDEAREMLWDGGADIASIVADVNRWSYPCRS